MNRKKPGRRLSISLRSLPQVSLLPCQSRDPFFQEPPQDPDLDVDRYFRDKDLEDLTLKTYDSLGLDVRGVMARSDLYARAGKNQHAFCLSVGREYPHDVRVLGNLISAQLRNHLETHVTRGPFYEDEVAGRYLIEAFGPGSRENWQDTVLRATGEPLSVGPFVGAIS